MPAGMSTVTVRVARRRPVPRHVSQGSRTIVPCPRHRLQVLVRTNCPKPPSELTSRVRPVPPHWGQLSRPVPGLAPLPWQVSQATSARISRSRDVPKAASTSSSSTSTSTSSPRGEPAMAEAPQGPLAPAPRSTEPNGSPPKNTSKRSAKPNCEKSGIAWPRRPSKP